MSLEEMMMYSIRYNENNFRETMGELLMLKATARRQKAWHLAPGIEHTGNLVEGVWHSFAKVCEYSVMEEVRRWYSVAFDHETRTPKRDAEFAFHGHDS